MKTIRYFLMAALTMFSLSLFAQNNKTEKIHVDGNCSTCKKNIEKAAKVNGVSLASWDSKTHVLTVKYDTELTGAEQIEKQVAAAGYDTENYRGDDKAYAALDDCCQYDRKPKKQ
jgi:mercuric ion binding protein